MRGGQIVVVPAREPQLAAQAHLVGRAGEVLLVDERRVLEAEDDGLLHAARALELQQGDVLADQVLAGHRVALRDSGRKHLVFDWLTDGSTTRSRRSSRSDEKGAAQRQLDARVVGVARDAHALGILRHGVHAKGVDGLRRGERAEQADEQEGEHGGEEDGARGGLAPELARQRETLCGRAS